ncbi:cilia- and flagella-associated protein 61-like [Ceratina calcarata]|uniref:Cilia- and flagella-associated protein 61-like n=1 Tax=Ceratina calcarata TaxID=156304 RepID=A0AAJ7WF60_9HYME|nr:cilia- and flagella-associated protein 61-like [Ceratina calcarata]
MCLCNYPNVPAVPPEDWMHWIYASYKVEDVTEMNTMFLHLLVWDKRYTGHFYEDLLTGLFDFTSYLQHVILVLPPQIILADVFEGQMIRVPPRCTTDRLSIQSIYVTERHLKNPRLRIRRVVEEDNDDVVPIIDDESILVKEFYGEFYVSEMVRYPDDCRRVIVSEDEDGLATGVMFLNSNIDVNALNENFELVLYNGLRKPHEKDYFPPGYMIPASETYFSFFSRKPRKETPESSTPSPERSMEDVHYPSESTSNSSVSIEVMPAVPKQATAQEKDPFGDKSLFDMSVTTFLSYLPSIDGSYRPTVTTAFMDSVYDIPQRKTKIESIEIDAVLQSDKVKVPSQPVYYGEVNAFVLEIFSMRDQVKRRWSRNFVEAAFECFPNLDYCAILVPFSHPFIHLLEHFMFVPLRCNKDYPMALHITHRAALLGQPKVREARLCDREDVQELLQKIPKTEQILADFDESMKEERTDLHCYVVQWEDVIVGVAIIRSENEVTYIKRRYHVEDYIVLQNIRHDAYGRILHFVLMPIFSIHLAHFFNEIMRFTNMMVLFYRLTGSALSALTRTHPLTICLKGMVPMHPRQRIVYKYHEFEETDEPQQETEPFSLFMTTPRLSMIPVTYVDSKIVVVGASDCGVAFVEQLAFG